MTWTTLPVMTGVTAVAGLVVLGIGVTLAIVDNAKSATRADALAALVIWLQERGNVAVIKGLGDGMTNLAKAMIANLEHETGAPAGVLPTRRPVATPQGTVEEVAKAVGTVVETMPKLTASAQLSLIGAVLLTVAAALSAVDHFR
jgi:hypothetical protein